jgi:hypothetical protein
MRHELGNISDAELDHQVCPMRLNSRDTNWRLQTATDASREGRATLNGRLSGQAMQGRAQVLNVEGLVEDDTHVHLLVGFTDFWRKMRR